jgi:DNA-binding MarR family transcriptional regulator
MSANPQALLRLFQASTKAGAAMTGALDDLVADLGLSSARGQILDVLVASQPRTVSQIARVLGLSRQAVQRLADDLVDRGLAAYARNPEHARAHLLSMTDQGANAHAEALRRKGLWLDALSEGLTPAWLDMASELLTLTARRAAQKPPKTI